VTKTSIDTSAATYQEFRAAMLEKVEDLREQLKIPVAGGGDKYVERHHSRGKLTVRERIELLLDQDTPFLELCALAGWHSPDHTAGGSLVFGIGVVEGTEVLIVATDPTVKAGAMNPWSLKKSFRAAELGEWIGLPTVSLVESAGADLPNQKDLFVPGGRSFRDLTRSSAQKMPIISVVFGNATAGGAYMTAMTDYSIFVKGNAKVFLAGPPLVKMATGEVSDDETLGGAEMHARKSGLADFLAEDEVDAIRLARQCVRRLNWRKHGQGPRTPDFTEPLFDAEELLGIVPNDIKIPFDPREVIKRIVDGSEFDEFKPLYGTSLVTGFAELHGYPIGILANAQGVLFSEEAQKAAQFIQLANQVDTPLLFLQNTTGFMVGAEYEQKGIIKHGAQMINAVANSSVPHLTINMAASYGAGAYAMSGRGYDPVFMFGWAGSRTAVMGSEQLAGVMDIVTREGAAKRGTEVNEEELQAIKDFAVAVAEEQGTAYFMSGMMYDDGVIDPRDTRAILGICLSVIANKPIEGAKGYGVFRL
jgi:acetyl-CoA carboxylase carboxyltransferase component